MPRAFDSIIISFWLCVFSLSLGCSPGIINKVVSEHEELGFLQIGKSTEQEMIAQVGEPNYRFEGGRVWVYSLVEDKRHRLNFPNESYKISGLDRASGEYHLILVFDENRTLARHSLLYYLPISEGLRPEEILFPFPLRSSP